MTRLLQNVTVTEHERARVLACDRKRRAESLARRAARSCFAETIGPCFFAGLASRTERGRRSAAARILSVGAAGERGATRAGGEATGRAGIRAARSTTSPRSGTRAARRQIGLGVEASAALRHARPGRQQREHSERAQTKPHLHKIRARPGKRNAADFRRLGGAHASPIGADVADGDAGAEDDRVPVARGVALSQVKRDTMPKFRDNTPLCAASPKR